MHTDSVKLSKLRPPPLPSAHLARGACVTRLIEALQGRRKVVLLSAPLGYGKTMLMAEYAYSLQGPWLWYRCDEADNQSQSMLVHLAHAMGLPVPETLNQRACERDLWSAIVSHLERQAQPLTLFLDDLHHLRHRTAIARLDELLKCLPQGLRVLGASQGNPALSITHLKRDGNLLVLDAADLALNCDEVSALAGARRLNLGTDLTYRLRAGNEGWLSGILFSLDACSQNPQVSLKVPSGMNPVTRLGLESSVQFIEEEILQNLSPNLLRFLERTSTVNAFDEPFAEHLSEEGGATTWIARIHRLGLFLQERNGEKLRYRYHPILRHALYKRLTRNPESLHQKHVSAADWLLEHGHLTEAAYQLGRAREFDRLAAVMDRYSFDLLKEERVGTLLDVVDHWATQNPDQFTQAIIEASTVMVTNDIGCASRCLARLRRLLRNNGVPGRHPERIRQTIGFLRSRIAYLCGNFAHGVEVVARACQRDPERNTAAAVLHFNLASCLAALGRLTEARPEAEYALEILEDAGFSGYTDSIRFLLCQLDLAQGQAQKASERFERVSGNCVAPATGSLYEVFQLLARAQILLANAESHQAESCISQAKSIALNFPHSAALPWVIHHQARLLADADQLDEARAHWQESRRIAAHFRLYFPYRLAGAWLARIAAINGDDAYLNAWLEEWHQCRRLYKQALLPEEWLAYAWVQRTRSKPCSALMIADKLIDEARTERNISLHLNALVLRGTLLHEQPAPRESMSCLEEALQLAATAPHCHLLVMEGARIGALFSELINPVARGRLGLPELLVDDNDLKRLLRFEESSASQPACADEVTRRELDVLKGIARQQSNLEIADQLHVSLSTVKTHINNLLRKLDAQDRNDAVRIAKARGVPL